MMKPLILTLVAIVVCTASLSAQNNVNLGFFLSYNNNSALDKKQRTSILGNNRTTEENNLNNSFGVSLYVEVFPESKISFLTGVDFFSYKINQIVGGLVFPSDIDPISGTVTTSEVINNAQHTYIGVPVALKYSFNKRNSGDTFFSVIGIEPTGVLTQRKDSKISYGNGSSEVLIQTKTKLNAFSLLAVFYAGYSKRLSDDFSLSVFPFFKISVFENGERYIIESSTHYFSFGGALGITYNLF